MKKTRTPLDLFHDQLRDLYSMEKQLSESLPRLATWINHPWLREAVFHHAEETTQQRLIIDGIFQKHQLEPSHDQCKAVAGLIEGGDAHLKSVDDPHTRDLMMIAHCLRIEHYEIAAYTITARLAEHLKLGEEHELLTSILKEETRTSEMILQLEPEIFGMAQLT